MDKDPILEQTVPTKKMAEELAKIIGCSGSHRVGDDAWGPCNSPRHLEKLIELGNPAFREWEARQKNLLDFLELKKVHRNKYRYSTEADAEAASRSIGCSGAHMSGQGVWRPCGTPEELNAALGNGGPGRNRVIRANRPPRRTITDRRVWDHLRQRGPRGVETVPGGGLVSGKHTPTDGMVQAASKAMMETIEQAHAVDMRSADVCDLILRRQPLSYDTVVKMKTFFDRHKNNDFVVSGPRWGMFGGDEGYDWVKSIVGFEQSDVLATRSSTPRSTPSRDSKRTPRYAT